MMGRHDNAHSGILNSAICFPLDSSPSQTKGAILWSGLSDFPFTFNDFQGACFMIAVSLLRLRIFLISYRHGVDDYSLVYYSANPLATGGYAQPGSIPEGTATRSRLLYSAGPIRLFTARLKVLHRATMIHWGRSVLGFLGRGKTGVGCISFCTCGIQLDF